ncbi:endonuclease domain-containing protein [Microbacterium sp. CJ88]|uniref:endonuclease domain-containing protein n=1 Tax=Microbacterium sp. CJ88 TaxID=3445672 RepID=UPI003F65E10A
MSRASDAVRRGGGVVRVGALSDDGIGRREVERAVTDGDVQRVRRGWLSVPDADPMLVNAARHGVSLTCVTQASRLGLWVLGEPGLHVASPPHAGHVRLPRATVHWAKALVPRHPDRLEDPIENVLVLVADCLPYEQALAVFESALRKGRVEKPAMARLSLPPAARRVLDDADPYADSGLETLVVPRLRWLDLPLRRQIWISGHRVDLLIGDRLVLQIDGGHHVGPQREADIAHDAALMLLGYHVIRVGYTDVVERWHQVQERIMRAVAQGLHRAIL